MLFPQTLTVEGYTFTKIREWTSPRGWEKAEYTNSACPMTTRFVLTGDFVSLSI